MNAWVINVFFSYICFYHTKVKTLQKTTEDLIITGLRVFAIFFNLLKYYIQLKNTRVGPIPGLSL